MATIDALSISLSALPSPLTKDNKAGLTVTANTSNGGSAANADRVEFILSYSPRGANNAATGSQGNGLLIPVKNVPVTSNAGSTGVFKNTFQPSDFNQPGTYRVLVKAYTIVSGNITVMKTADSAEFFVQDVNQADINNLLTDEQKQALDIGSDGRWREITLSGARIKQLVADPSQQAQSIKLMDLAAGTILLGGAIVTNIVAGVTGAKANLGSGTSANNIITNAAIDSAAEVDVAATFVPLRVAAAAALNLKIDMGSGATISQLADGASLTVAFCVAQPIVFNL
jgi:hypothetical protein